MGDIESELKRAFAEETPPEPSASFVQSFARRLAASERTRTLVLTAATLAAVLLVAALAIGVATITPALQPRSFAWETTPNPIRLAAPIVLFAVTALLLASVSRAR